MLMPEPINKKLYNRIKARIKARGGRRKVSRFKVKLKTQIMAKKKMGSYKSKRKNCGIMRGKTCKGRKGSSMLTKRKSAKSYKS